MPRKTKLGFAENEMPDDGSGGYGEYRDESAFPAEHPEQRAWLGTSEELNQRQDLRHLLIAAWKLRRNEAWRELVKEYISKNRVNLGELESYLEQTQAMSPEAIELLFPNLPLLSWRLRDAKDLRMIPET